MKIIRVEKCRDCWFSKQERSEVLDKWVMWCLKTHNKVDENTIDLDCPLPDEKE